MRGNTIIALIFGFFVGLYFIYYGMKTYKQYRLIKNTPTSAVQSISIGRTELMGRAKPYDDTELYNHPIRNRDCLYYKKEIEKYKNDDDGGNWETIHTGHKGNKFYLDDNTGRILIKTEDPTLDLENKAMTKEKYKITPDDEVPDALNEVDAGEDTPIVPDFLEQQTYKVTVEAIYPNAELYVLGYARSRSSTNTYAQNEKNVVVGNPEYAESTITSSIPLLGRSKEFLIANQDRENLIEERKYLAPMSFFVGLLLSAGCLFILLTVFGL